MSIIIINSRVFSAKNPTVNDASGVTMLFAEAGMILVFRRTTTVCYMIPTCSCLNGEPRAVFFHERECKTGVDPERSDYGTLRVERGTCFNPLQALITAPLNRLNAPRLTYSS